MKLPQAPPSLPDQVDDRTDVISAFAQLMGNHDQFVVEANDAYQPWDKFRFFPMPAGLENEHVWQALQIFRKTQRRQLPFVGAGGEQFYWSMISHRLVDLLLQTDAAARDPLGLVEPSSAVGSQREFLVSSQMEEAIHSSLIEGAATTRQAAKAMLREGRTPRTEAERMVVNNFAAIEMLSDVAREPLTVELICRLQAVLTDGLLETADAGRIQVPGEERVVVQHLDGTVVHVPPPASELPERLARLCAFANATDTVIPPVVLAIVLHFQLAYDHPFVDGNGRTARALFYWAMLRHGYWLFRYVTISRVISREKLKYARTYVHCEQTHDLTYFVLYQLDVIQRAVAGLADALRQREQRLQTAEATLSHWPMLNYRQCRVLVQSLKDPSRAVRTDPYRGTFRVTRQTALNDLNHLTRLGLLTKAREGRNVVFRAPPDLDERLRDPPDQIP